MPAFGLLAIDQRIARHYLEATTRRRDQLERVDHLGVVVEQICCRTDSTGGVVSLYTIFNADFILLHAISPTDLLKMSWNLVPHWQPLSLAYVRCVQRSVRNPV
jgi:hypothetical protein